jgi:hypothetical protein
MTSSSMSGAMKDTGSTDADKRLNSQIRQSLNADTSLAGVGRNVHLTTENGKVTLHGSVSSEAEKQQIEQKVKQMSDVDDVQNQLQVASSGSSSATGSSATGSSSGSSSMGGSSGSSSSRTNPSGSPSSTGSDNR